MSNFRHGYSGEWLFSRWRAMVGRCHGNGGNKWSQRYKDKGIQVCNEWRASYESFRDWAMSQGAEKWLTLDRINNDGDYTPDNCRWVSYALQSVNQDMKGHNTSGYRGISFDKRSGKWRAKLNYKNKTLFDKYYTDIEHAIHARDAFIVEHNLPHHLNR